MHTLFDDDDSEDVERSERQPLTRSRSRSPPPRLDESEVEPPDLGDRGDEGTNVLGYLFGSEIHLPSSRPQSTRQGSYQSVRSDRLQPPQQPTSGAKPTA